MLESAIEVGTLLLDGVGVDAEARELVGVDVGVADDAGEEGVVV